MKPDKLQASVDEGALQVYALGSLSFETLLRLQKRLHFDVSGDRAQAAVVLCEHAPFISVGRQGSRAHILYEESELRTRQWPVRWLPRGGGCLLHLPGQVGIYPFMPLDRLGLTVRGYLAKLATTIAATLAEFSLLRPIAHDHTGVSVGSRLIAAFGVAVRDWVTTYGVYFNLDPNLEEFRRVRHFPVTADPMTSLARERRGLVRPALVRQRLVEHFQTEFGFSRIALFTDHPALHAPPPRTGTLAVWQSRQDSHCPSWGL